MKVRVPLMIQDPLTSRYKGMRLVEDFFIDEEAFFLDGPVTKRVAVLDFDAETGALRHPARFLPPTRQRALGRYKIPEGDVEGYDIRSPEFMQVSAFATVLRALYMFEEPDALGREVCWAFGAPQLLVVPRAGEWANAYYERDSHSLQFFYLTLDGGEPIFTCLSRDIIAHETGHAILDGIAPDLYSAITPQSLALHEALADLTALMMAFRSHNLRSVVLDQTGGSIENSTAFSSVAEEFGRALDRNGRAGYLRSLLNERTLDPDDKSLDEYGKANRVPRNEPHALSEVLSGALFKMMVQLHNSYKQRTMEKEGLPEFSASGKALWVAAEQFKRMVYRALDYLPPGEVSFADYGRALVAADQALYPADEAERVWLKAEFARRRIVASPHELDVQTNQAVEALKDLNLEALVESDWAAYDFANRNRKLLRIPENVPFTVRPRLDAAKVYFDESGKRQSRECIFKVSWNEEERNNLGHRFPPRRQMTVGTVLAIDWETKVARALLTTDRSEQQAADRSELLLKLDEDGLLIEAARAVGPDGQETNQGVVAETTNRLMRLRGTARMLHIVGEGRYG
ncbi:MAG: hypothetical protein GXY76_12620 [Chloroflexi bacterium]|nr:hypothetical protein [Chloroflexota bacterium]